MLHEALLLLRGQQEEAALFLEALSFECHIKRKSNSEDVCLTLLFGETAENGKQQIAPSSPMTAFVRDVMGVSGAAAESDFLVQDESHTLRSN